MASAVRPSPVRIVVVGDEGVGKSSLITAVTTETFPERVPPLLPEARLPPGMFPDHVSVAVVDTSSRPSDKQHVEKEIRNADAIVLAYACDNPDTLDRVREYWLPDLRRLEVVAPVIVVGCKLDLRSDNAPTLEQVMQPIMNEFREIETSLECSARRLIQVAEVFYYAQRAVLHPTAPLFDTAAQVLKPRCLRALRRIFLLCDHDKDGTLNDDELNDFQITCFNAPLQPEELAGVKRVVSEKMPSGVVERGLTVTGFLFLHALFIERGRLETTWTVLRKFGYGPHLTLRPEEVPTQLLKRLPDQTVELTDKALDFLRDLFAQFDTDSDGALRDVDVEELFNTLPANPWEAHPFIDAAQRSPHGYLTLNGFLSLWALSTYYDPATAMEHLQYLNYATVDFPAAFKLQRRRRADRRKKRVLRDRTVVTCFVFGPPGAGKTALLGGLIGRPFKEEYPAVLTDRYAAAPVDLGEPGVKTLILREIHNPQAVLDDNEGLACCDVAAFVYDGTSLESLDEAGRLLTAVAEAAEAAGNEVPCLLLANKADLHPEEEGVEEEVLGRSVRLATDLGLEAAVPVSLKTGERRIYTKLAECGLHPGSRIPETAASKVTKKYRSVIQKTALVTAGVAAVVGVSFIAYRYYATRKRD